MSWDKQPANEVEVLALGEYVEYWNRLSWRSVFFILTLAAKLPV